MFSCEYCEIFKSTFLKNICDSLLLHYQTYMMEIFGKDFAKSRLNTWESPKYSSV